MMIPPSVQRLFHRYHADRLDPRHHAAIIIPTILEEGAVEDWRWLFSTYSWDTIQRWIADPTRASQLSPRVEWFWTTVLLGTPHETSRWSGGNRRRRIPRSPFFRNEFSP
ncbi:MAG: DUF6922 domain-containing protein [Clostridia bacterium]